MSKKTIEFLVVIGLGVVTFALSFIIDEAKTILLIVGLVIIALAIGYLFYKNDKPAPVDEKYKYKKKDSLMSEPEKILYNRLLGEVGKEYDIFPQIALLSVVDKITSASFRNELFRVVDFVLCDRISKEPQLVIELNDASHLRSERRERDEKVKCILERAGLPLLTLALDEINAPDLRKRVLTAIKK